jgi:hypothetical protein
MDKVIKMEDIIVYKKACDMLRRNQIPFNEEELKNNIEFCKAIITLLTRYD